MKTLTKTQHPFCIRHEFLPEESSAISLIEILPTSLESLDAYDVLISWRNSDKVYRFAVEDDATAEKWYSLLSNEEDFKNTSWGYEVSRARKHGDIEPL